MTTDGDGADDRLRRAAARAEDQVLVPEALNGLDPLDREVLALRHFEMLSNEETARVLASGSGYYKSGEVKVWDVSQLEEPTGSQVR